MLALDLGMLTGNTGRDDDNVGTGHGLLHAIVGWQVALDLCDRGDVGKVGGDTWGIDDIVEGKLVNEGAGLQQEGQRLYGDGS